MEMHNDMEGNRQKGQHRKILLGRWRKAAAMRVINDWKMLSRYGVESPSLEMFKVQVGRP